MAKGASPFPFGRREPWRTRRDFIWVAGAAAGLAVGMAGPSFAGTADSASAPVTVRLAPIRPGQQIEIRWNGRRVFVRRRTPEEIAAARAAPIEELRHPQRDEERVIDPEWLVVIGECTHAGCRPLVGLGGFRGWLCLCHGSHFDTSGRIRKGPALTNLEVPPYRFLSAGLLEIGVSGQGSDDAHTQPWAAFQKLPLT